ncbi:hypothetical protein [Cellulosimicrobium sp. TH-20]|uniref:hypothetical protein n=1 Tax=Cellulosimicrobium sp. TH-20 TaxID=1980001 RepID=UPI0012FA1695|nr:hypothetical protein [Cellulosimicrobium sp. TH-20]
MHDDGPHEPGRRAAPRRRAHPRRRRGRSATGRHATVRSRTRPARRRPVRGRRPARLAVRPGRGSAARPGRTAVGHARVRGAGCLRRPGRCAGRRGRGTGDAPVGRVPAPVRCVPAARRRIPASRRGYPPPPGSYPGAAGGYGGQPGYAGPAFGVGDAISYGWRRVTSNLGPWILVALIFLAVNIAWSWITGGFDQLQDQFDYSDTNFAALGGLTFTRALLAIVGTAIGYLITAFFTRGALDEVDGRRPDVAAFFRIGNVLNVLLAALIVGILSGIGFFLCVLPGLAMLLFSAFVYYVALDQGVDAITAIRTSFSLVAKNFGQVFLLLLALVGINILGAIPCGLGLFVTLPLSYVAVGYAYRRLTGGVPAA